MFTLSVGLIVAMSFALFGTGLLNPIFLQEFMGYTAWRRGWCWRRAASAP